MHSQSLSSHRLIAALLVLCCAQATFAADGDAITEINGEAGVAYAYDSNRQEGLAEVTRNAWSAVGQLNIPIWRYFGGNVRADVGRASIDVDIDNAYGLLPADAASYSCSGNEWLAGASLFARNQEWGRVRGSYDTGRQLSCDSYLNVVSASATSVTRYGGDVEAYVGRWTFGAQAGRETFDYGAYSYRSSSYSALLAFYPSNEWRASVGVTHLPSTSGANYYGAGLEYQPAWLDNRWGMRLGYRRLSEDWMTENNWIVNVSYYFGPSGDLLTRDRQLR